MDGLSVAASIIAVVQITGQVITYLSDVKDAPRECESCMIELYNSNILLLQLKARASESISQGPWYAKVQALNVKDGPLDQYKRSLEDLLHKVEAPRKLRKLMNALLWSWIKEEVASLLVKMERLKTLVNIALEMDHFKLSQAIKDDTMSIRDALPPLQEHAIAIRHALPQLQENAVAIRDAQSLQQHHDIMEWLSPTDFPAQQHDIITRRQEGTGQWFLNSPEFKSWLQGSEKTLFCPGIPGAGKTMTSAIAIDHLCRTAQADVGLAYLFCNYKSQADQSVHSLLSALLKQLVQSQPDIAAPVTRLHEHHSKQKSRPSLHEIFTALLTVCSSYSRVYIAVDALDECTDRDRTRSELVENLRELQTRANVQLLFTSRFIPDITQKFQSNLMLEVRASENDVRLFVAGQMPRLPKYDEQLKSTIEDRIVEAVDGMFLLARLYVELLRDKRRKRDVLSTLNQLPKGEAALDDAYDKAIKQIDDQLPGDRLLARRALSWITYAQRPLTTKELCHAVSIEPGDKALDEDDIYDVESMISVCAGLVTVDEESSIIRLVHYTTQEYFERVRLEWNPGAQEEIALACLTYLSFDGLRSGSCASDAAFEQRLAENALFDYVAHYWSDHIRPVENISSCSCLALAFLYDETLVDSTIQAASVPKFKRLGFHKKYPYRSNGLHLTAMYGLYSLTETLLVVRHCSHDIGVDSKDISGRTPLSRAAASGHLTVVKLLVDRDDVEVDSKDIHGRTPLSRAAESGHLTVVRLLVDRDVEVDSKDHKGRTPLSLAAENGHEAVVKLLVDREDVEAHSKDGSGSTPLSWAVGHEAVVKLLVDRDDVEADSKNKWGQTPLLLAAAMGYEAVVKLLVDRDDVEADSKDGSGSTPLSWAAITGHEAVVKLLVDRDDVEADSKGKWGQTPLLLAAAMGCEAVVKLLVDRDDVEADSKDNSGRTPLSCAADGGHEAVVKLLVNRDDKTDSKDNSGQTPLS